jgi:hypothetical protein
MYAASWLSADGVKKAEMNAHYCTKRYRNLEIDVQGLAKTSAGADIIGMCGSRVCASGYDTSIREHPNASFRLAF